MHYKRARHDCWCACLAMTIFGVVRSTVRCKWPRLFLPVDSYIVASGHKSKYLHYYTARYYNNTAILYFSLINLLKMLYMLLFFGSLYVLFGFYFA